MVLIKIKYLLKKMIDKPRRMCYNGLSMSKGVHSVRESCLLNRVDAFCFFWKG